MRSQTKLALASALGAAALGAIVAFGQRGGVARSSGASEHVGGPGDASGLTLPPSAPPSGGPSAPDLGPGVSARTATIEGESGARLAYRVLRVDLSSASLTIVAPPGAKLERLADEPTLWFAVNGGFFEPSLEPSGLLFSRGRRLGAFAPRGGSGVLWVAGGRAQIMRSDRALPELAGADLALQCGPRLVEGGRPGVHRDDGRRAARTALCLREGGRLLDVVLVWDVDHPGEGPGLYRLAELLSRPSPVGDAAGCDDALNLDGGPSTGLATRALPEGWGPRAPGPVPWALAVLRP